MDDTEVVRLSFPAHPEYARLARLTAARLARRRRFTYREVEDLRIAIDESMVALLAEPDPERTIDLVFTLGPDALEVELDGPPGGGDEGEERFATMTEDLVDEATFDPGTGRATLRKHHVAVDGERVPARPPPGHDPDERGPIRGV